MARSFKLPDLGEGIHEGEVLSVLITVGDDVKEGDIILEVETDKAAVEIPSPFTATIQEIFVKPGDVVRVGDVLVNFSNGEKSQEEAAPAERRREPLRVNEELETEVNADEGQRPGPGKQGPVPASPATRRLARELGVSLRDVTPSGPQGLVTAEDVRVFAERGKHAGEAGEKSQARVEKAPEARPITMPDSGLPDFGKWGPIEAIPVTSIRRATARQMALSWSQIPHVASYDQLDLTRLEAFRQEHKAGVEERGGNLSYTVFALKAVAGALKQHPRFNASLDMEKGEIILKHFYHVGVAVATDDGLIVPVVRDVDRKSIIELSIELRDLVERTRQRKIKLEEMQGGTFTITNIGPLGGGHFAPIINFPEVAILGMGSARMDPVVIEKRDQRYDVVPKLVMPVVLSIDHRLLDGADALRFMKTLKGMLEDPGQMLMSI